MAITVTTFTQVIEEKSSAVYTVTVKDNNGTAIGSGSMDALTLTLVNRADDTVLNSRTDQNVLNANNVTVSGLGVITFTLQAADTAMVDPLREFETHRATFKLTYGTTNTRNWAVDFNIHNLKQVT